MKKLFITASILFLFAVGVQAQSTLQKGKPVNSATTTKNSNKSLVKENNTAPQPKQDPLVAGPSTGVTRNVSDNKGEKKPGSLSKGTTAGTVKPDTEAQKTKSTNTPK